MQYTNIYLPATANLTYILHVMLLKALWSVAHGTAGTLQRGGFIGHEL